MIELDHQSATLFRLLSEVFGTERVIPHMSIRAVCGGNLPEQLDSQLSKEIELEFKTSVEEWSKKARCLFTVVNQNDDPGMVVDMASDLDHAIDVEKLTLRKFLGPVLMAAGVNYVSISDQEFQDLINPRSSLTLVSLLQDRFGIAETSDSIA